MSATALERLGRAGLVLGGILLGLLGAELIARAAWPERPPVPERVERELPELRSVFDLARPNTEGMHAGVYYRTNSHGLRGPEWEADPGEDVFRIVIAGDSNTVGAGVSEDARYSSQLEDLLNADGTGRRYEIVNTALGGLNIEQALRRLERVLPYYGADLLIYGLSINDIDSNAYRELPGRPDPKVYLAWVTRTEDARSYLWRFVSAWLYSLRWRPYRTQELVDNYFHNPPAWRELTLGLDHFAELGRDRGICAELLIHTQMEALDDSHPYLEIYERVATAGTERGLRVTRSFPWFEGEAARDLWVSPFDSHPNRSGHAIYAQRLYTELRALPASCWEGGL